MKQHTTILLISLLFLLCGNDTGNNASSISGLKGIIYSPDGQKGASGAWVTVYTADAIGSEPVAEDSTDSNGHYTFTNLPIGTYTLWAVKDSHVLFRDSIEFSTAAQTFLCEDTLEYPSTLTGCVRMHPCHDPRTVTVDIAGSNLQQTVSDGKGSFYLKGLAKGTYTIITTTTLPEYTPDTTFISIASNKHVILEDTINLTYNGFPMISDVKVSQDTIRGWLYLSWNGIEHPSFQDYVIYRDECKSFNFSEIITGATRDTFFIDSTFTPPKTTDPFATFCLEYRVAMRNDLQEIGPICRSARIQFVLQTYASTYFQHFVQYFGPSITYATINDSVRLSVTARNPGRALRSLAWYIPDKHDTISTIDLKEDNRNELSDTITLTFDTVGFNFPIVIVTDAAETQWFDTIPVYITSDAPKVFAGNDTGVLVGSRVRLQGMASDSFGTICKWEWKIGPEAWTTTDSPFIDITASSREEIQLCSLAVTDDDWNRSADAVWIITDVKAQSVAACSSYSLILKDDGILLGCGKNNDGQLGNGQLSPHTFPDAIMAEVQGMAAGYVHTLILQKNGTVWVCGGNDYGQLGTSTNNHEYQPIPIMENVKRIASGKYHSLFLKNDSTLWACGWNLYGQLGDGTTEDRALPVAVMSDVVDMAAGHYHTLILKTDGTVWACGENGGGQLGDGTTEDRTTPVSVMSDVISIAAGSWHSFFVTTDNSLWACGNNGYGQIGDGTDERRISPVKIMPNIRKVTTSSYHSLLLQTDGTLLVCGLNPSDLPTDLKADVWYTPVRVMTGISDMASGYYHCLIMTSEGTVWAWGRNENYQLGDGTASTKSFPICIHPPQQIQAVQR